MIQLIRLLTKIMVVVIGLLIISPISYADGNKLLKDCGAIIHSMDTNEMTGSEIGMGFCLGMVSGVRNTMAVYQETLQRDGSLKVACIPGNNIDNIQLVRIVTSYLKNHPEKLHEHESFLTINAFLDAYPCS